MYNYNNTTNNINNNKNNNKMEETKMNEIRMAAILEKLDKSGVKVGFGTQVPAQLAQSDKPYMTGYMTGTVPTNMMNNMLARGAVGGVGLTIEGEKETPELMELMSYLSKNPYEGASLVRFCQKCLLAGNVPVRKVIDIVDEDCDEEYLDNSVYFICSNGKVLIRNGEEFEVVYEGVVLPNLQTMSDDECLDVIHSAVETYSNLVEPDRDDEDEDYEDENYENGYDDEDEDCKDESDEDEETHAMKVFLTLKYLPSECTPEIRAWVENVIEDILRAHNNDDIIRETALIDTLEGLKDTYQNQKKEGPKCGEEEDGQQNWIF